VSQNKQPDPAAHMAGLVGQIGCVTSFASFIIIGIAFAAGRFLDSMLETGGIFTVLFLIGSFPITLYVIVRISLFTLSRVQQQQPASQTEQTEDESTPEENTKK
jgi:F0F1-type ATP synthase assembly protein I